MSKFEQAFSQGDVMRRLQELEDRVRELTAGRRLESAAIGSGGVRVARDGVIRSTDFDGNMANGDPGTVGWALGRSLLALQGAFAVPIEFGGNKDEVRGFAVNQALPPPDQVILSVQIDVPPWADEAIIFALACATLENTSATNDFAYLSAAIRWTTSDGQQHQDIGSEQFVQLDPGRWGNLNTNSSRIVTDLSGPLTIDARMRTDENDWPSAPQSLLDLDGFVIFRRAGVRTGSGETQPVGDGGGSGGVTDHGDLAGLADDDHTQYLNQLRGDARYYTQSQVDTALAGKSDTGHLHDARYYTETEVDNALAGKSDTSHLHDGRYYTETEVDNALAGKSDTGHSHRPINSDSQVYSFSSGEAFIDHGLGVTPVAVVAVAQGAVNNVATLDYTSTQFRAFIRNINTGNALTGNERLHWIAIA